ncbi:TetR/AcrR family transcriptional regulator [Paenibacillus puerhi]|uniref:TetR/AcrR family transcriptional regulator n=1 Tax=Paenibacillus puerhi TaxID=2692622 RepID=UPI00135852DE|nr:TetR/AcrR family transcriptional regulator [Paenibacillus puerhi]
MSKNKRNDILEAALHLFADRGYDGTTVPAIADAAQVGAGTIYRYFETKEELVNSLFQESVQQLSNALLTGAPADPGAIRERYDHIFNQMCEFAAYRGRTLAFIDSHSGAPFLNTESRESFDRFLSLIREVLEEGKRLGIICPLPSDVLIAIVYGAMVKLFNVMGRGVVEQTPELFAQVQECCWNAIRVH